MNYSSSFMAALERAKSTADDRVSSRMSSGPLQLMSTQELVSESLRHVDCGVRVIVEIADHWWEKRFGPPAKAVAGIEGALRAVDALSPRWSEHDSYHVRSYLHAVLGNALRQLGRHGDAKASLDLAESLADHRSREESFAMDLKVSLLLDLGKWEEARWQSGRVIARWRLLQDSECVDNARLQRARARRYLGDQEGALRDYAVLVETASATLTRLIVAQNIAEIFSTMQRWAAAEEVLSRAEPLFLAHDRRILKIKRGWILGRVRCGQGNYREAERLLSQAYDALLSDSRTLDAAECSLDLCLIYRAERRWPALMRTARAAAEALATEGVDPAVVTAVLLIRDAARGASVKASAIRWAQERIRLVP